MPRTARILPTPCMLHIIGRSNNKVRLFRDDDDFFTFKDMLQKYTDDELIFIHHYTLMTTHFHVLAWVEQKKRLPCIMKGLTLSYFHHFQKKYTYRGHLWHGRYKSVPVVNEFHWLQCGRYIELNSVHAGICTDPNDYPWSSYHYHAAGAQDPLISLVIRHDEMKKHKPGKPNKAYREFVLAGIDLDYHAQKRQFENWRGRSPFKYPRHGR